MCRVLLIIPAYNEEANILNTVNMVWAYQKQLEERQEHYSLDYVVINDGSKDRTKEIIEEHQLNAVHLIQNLGIGGAVQTGYKYAFQYNYDIAVQFDGDGQHDINSLDAIVKPIIDGEYDFCVGSRFIDGSSSEFQTTSMRRAGIKIISFLIKLVTGKRIYDVTSGYRAANKEIIHFFCTRYPTEYPEPETIVHLLKRKARIKECPVNMMERAGGKSSIHSFKSVKYMVEVGTAILISAFMKEGD
ncbi:glycosyltransferase family 2 protein [Enterococcus sp. LJL51]|uniref:glycosyltransferase family 2 protein n=1 Tax=Enterococcus sp. LJL51 TaxID=3416656 RepID=UPI003CEE4269